MSLSVTNKTLTIDAMNLHYKVLNAKLREAVAAGIEKIDIMNVFGQRYIGTDLNKPVEINIHGVPGNDLGSFMDGPKVIVHGNAQDATGNTMNNGEIIIHGNAGDTVGLSARGGKIFVKGDAGYRVAIHMKEYLDKKPKVVIGGTTQDFVGEYMAGGVLVMLGLNLKTGQKHHASYIGTGIHAGVIYLRGEVEKYQLGKEVGVADLEEKDWAVLKPLIEEFSAHFGYNASDILKGKFSRLFPLYLRPYGRLYA